MPNRDGTGPMSGGRRGRGRGRGAGRRGVGRNTGTSVGSAKCVCPNCGHVEAHERGVPCTQTACPKCGAKMQGENC